MNICIFKKIFIYNKCCSCHNHVSFNSSPSWHTDFPICSGKVGLCRLCLNTLIYLYLFSFSSLCTWFRVMEESGGHIQTDHEPRAFELRFTKALSEPAVCVSLLPAVYTNMGACFFPSQAINLPIAYIYWSGWDKQCNLFSFPKRQI